MSDPYIKAEDRIDVIGRLTARLDDARAETLREKAVAHAKAMSGPLTPYKPVKHEGENDQKEIKEEGEKEEGGKEGLKDEGEKDQKEIKEEVEKEEKEGMKEGKEEGGKEGLKDEGEKDHKDDKDGDEKNLPKEDPKDGIIEGPNDRSTAPKPERIQPGRPVM